MTAKTAPAFDPKDMPYRNLGSSGLRVPIFSFGSWLTLGGTVKGDPVKELMQLAWDAGCNAFDNAEVYSGGEAEREMGRVFKELGWKRSDFIVTTKIFFGTGRKEPNSRGLSRKHIIEGMKDSLERLQLDYVDVVHAHRADVSVPMEETVRAFNYLIDQGLTFYWGTSEWSAQQIQEAITIADRLGLARPITEQPQYSALVRERFEVEYDPLFKHYNYGTTIWSPLKSGVLTGKYNGGKVPEGSRYDTNKGFFADSVEKLQNEEGKKELAIVEKLTEYAKTKLDCSVSQLALAWAASNKNVSTVLLGATKPEQLKENFGAIPIIAKMTPEVLEDIEKILGNKPKGAPTYGR